MIQIQKQPMMRRVVYALSPLFLFSIYLYGWRSLSIMAVTIVFGYLSEYVMERILKKKKDVKVTEAFLVTSFLFALSLPPALGELQNLWVVAIGIIFGIVFGKMVYGGFGRNVFNPAIAGRLFIFLAFPGLLTSGWMLGGTFGLDAVAGVTPLVPLSSGIPTAMSLGLGDGSSVALNMFLGTRAGALGESSLLLILAGAIYLLWTKTAQLRLMAAPIVGAFLTASGLYYIPLWMGAMPIVGAMDPFYSVMAGGLIFVSVFMVTEPVTAPNKAWGQIIYGLMIGVLVVVIRTFSQLPESVSFAVILGNTFAGLIDELLPKADPKSQKPDWTIKVLFAVTLVLFAIASPWVLGNQKDSQNPDNYQVYQETVLKVMGVPVTDDQSVTELYNSLDISYYHDWEGTLHLLGTNATLSARPDLANVIFYKNMMGQEPVYGITFSGHGLWGLINGIVSVNADVTKTVGFEIISHSEQRGASVASEEFASQFYQGIELANDTIALVPEVSQTGEIQAITGATTTSNAITEQLARSFAMIKQLTQG